MRDQGLRVLVVDDEGLIRWAIGEALAQGGHEVLQAPDGATARELVRRTAEPIDVVLLDYRLPDCNGMQLLDELHALTPRTGVVIMTASGEDPALTAAALDHGVRRVLGKPFDLAVIDHVVREAAA